MVAELILSQSDNLAHRLGISAYAVELARDAEILDLHIDTFIPMRAFGYDVRIRHESGLFRGTCFGHLDIPRAYEAGLVGGMWSITTNPFRTIQGRWNTFLNNLEKVKEVVRSSSGLLRLVRNYREYKEARAAGAHACMLAVQGGNCFDGALGGVKDVPGKAITRVTLLHLTNSKLGVTSSPASILRREKGLTARGRAFVQQLNEERVFVDLAHIHPEGFWDAVDAHDSSQPLIVTHTGIAGVNPSWRNLSDKQLKAVADTGGTIGIIYSTFFLRGPRMERSGRLVVEHMQHVIDTVGEDFVSVGSDYDGAIIPPPDLRSGDSYPRLVQYMLDKGWSEQRIRKILGLNYLRAFKALRPG